MSWMKKIIEIKDGLARYADAAFDASAITSGTIDAARLPPTEGVVVASGDITTLTPTQQATIVEGALVVLGAGAGADAGKSYRYDGSGSKTSLANYVEQQTTVSWTSVTSKPDAVTSIGALTPIADRIAYYTGAASAALATITAAARSLLDDADSSAMRTTLSAMARLTGNTNVIPKMDANGDPVASGLSDDGTTVTSSRKVSANGSVTASEYNGGGPSVIAGDGQYGFSAQGGILRFFSSVSILLKKPVAVEGDITASNLAGTGDRPAVADSTGKLKPDPRAGVQTAGAISVAINATTKRILRVTGAASLQLGNPADCAGVAVKVVAAFSGSVAITGEHQYSEAAPDYWYYSSSGRSVTVSNFGTDGYLKAFDLWCDGVHWYFQA